MTSIWWLMPRRYRPSGRATGTGAGGSGVTVSASRERSEPDAGLPEGVAGAELAALHPGLERVHALGARAVGEALRHHVSARLLLQPIVPDRRRRAEARIDVGGLD